MIGSGDGALHLSHPIPFLLDRAGAQLIEIYLEKRFVLRKKIGRVNGRILLHTCHQLFVLPCRKTSFRHKVNFRVAVYPLAMSEL